MSVQGFRTKRTTIYAAVAAASLITFAWAQGAPFVEDDQATTPAGSPVDINVLANDVGDWVDATVGDPGNGTVVVMNTIVRYTPDSGFVGIDSFTYTVTDSTGPVLSATVTVDVTPAAVSDEATTTEDTPVIIDVLANDAGTWVDAVIGQPPHGATVEQGGAVLYTPDAGFVGQDAFWYTLTDAGGVASRAIVTIEVTEVLPTAVNDDAAISHVDTGVVIDVLANDVVDPVHVSISTPANGQAEGFLLPDGPRLVYRPNPGFIGLDSLTYTVTDSGGAELTATVTIDVRDTRQASFPTFTCAAADPYCNSAASAGLDIALAYGRGAAMVDMDGDGLLDIFDGDSDARQHPSGNFGVGAFYHNNGDATFDGFGPANVGVSIDDLVGNWGGSFADYDNDGDRDVIFVNGGYSGISNIALYENRLNETGQFVSTTVSSGIDAVANGTPSRWWGVSWADFDNDGFLDVVVTRIVGTALLFHNQGDGTFVEVAASMGITHQFLDNQPGSSFGEDGKNPVWIDYDGDGDQDLYFSGIYKHAFYENLNGAQFVDITAQLFSQAFPPNVNNQPLTPVVFAAAAADFDQDGADDLYLGRWDEQDLILFNDGTGGFQSFGAAIGLDALRTNVGDFSQLLENTMGLGIGDLLDDGYPDVFIGTGNPERAGPDIFYCNNGVAKFFRCTEIMMAGADSVQFTRGHGISFGDFDDDGDTDVFINLGGHPEWDIDNQADTRETNLLFLRQPATPANTATLTLQGTASNRDALGARVTVDLGTRKHYYTMRSTQGFQSQNSNALIMTLGNLPTAPVEVRWPSGAVTNLMVVSGQRLHLVE